VAAAHGVAIPATAVVTQLVNALIASGGADQDYSAVGTVLFDLAGLT
jgi:3-hydroxyisobutyrate dehydrogenase-like beta-hydroxyacid dehydrogenase